MLLKKDFRIRPLFFSGLAALTVANIMQAVLRHSVYSNDLTDLLLGMLFGIGFGLMILVAWRMGRNGHDEPDNAGRR
ncbi:MAG: hypothetical protein ABI718_10165 [Acidobacteriota bacterium]